MSYLRFLGQIPFRQPKLFFFSTALASFPVAISRGQEAHRAADAFLHAHTLGSPPGGPDRQRYLPQLRFNRNKHRKSANTVRRVDLCRWVALVILLGTLLSMAVNWASRASSRWTREAWVVLHLVRR
jgi:hypothetical protein